MNSLIQLIISWLCGVMVGILIVKYSSLNDLRFWVELIVQVMIAVAAMAALKQISLAKESFRLNSERESIKLSVELIKEFRENILRLSVSCDQLLKQFNIRKYEGGEKLSHFSMSEVARNTEYSKHFMSVLDTKIFDDISFNKDSHDLSNSVEYFATPFIEKIADEKVAFKVVGLAYCSIVEKYYFILIPHRKESDKQLTYYKNTIELYHLWSKRISKTNLIEMNRELQASIDEISDRTINPIGT